MALELTSRLSAYLNTGSKNVEQREPGFNARGAIIGGQFVRELLPHQMLGASTPSDQLRSLSEYIFPLPHSLSSRILLDTGENVVQIDNIKQVITIGEVLPQDAEQLFPLLELGYKSESLDQIATQLEPVTTASVDTLVDIHQHEAEEIQRISAEGRKILYLRGTGSIIANRDLALGVFDFAQDSGSWVGRYNAEYMSLMLKARNRLGTHPERLSTIHGDFWLANLYMTADGSILVTDPRISYGEPAGDLTALVAELLLKDLMELGNFKGPLTNLAKKMIERYKLVSGDEKVTQFMGLNYGFKALAEAVLSLQSGEFSREILATGIGVLQNTIDGEGFNLDNLDESRLRGMGILSSWES